MKSTLSLQIIIWVNSLTFSQTSTSLFTYGGLPQNAQGSEIKILVNSAYAVGYSDDLKNPVWAVYRLGNPKGTGANQRWERTRSFAVDPRTDAKVDHEDYTGSGFDRGHMVPNASILNQYGQMAQLETFLMSNICPQKPAMNRTIWADLEEEARRIASIDKNNKEVHDVFVIVGPIFETTPPATLTSGIAIPTSFYMIIAFQQGFGDTIKAVSVIVSQEPLSSNFEDFLVTVDAIEGFTGIDFFPDLSAIKQTNLESKKRNFQLEEVN